MPESLADLWDDDLKALLFALPFNHQSFVLEYVSHSVGSRAYEKVYGVKAPASYSCASDLLRNAKVRAFITAYRAKDAHRHEDDKELIRSTYRAGMLADNSVSVNGEPVEGASRPDHDTRIKAANALAKLDGHNAAEVVTVNPSDEFRKLWTVAKAVT